VREKFSPSDLLFFAGEGIWKPGVNVAEFTIFTSLKIGKKIRAF
jgi:hypothetical protein